jgi:phage-related baseplate assembly protein
MPVVTFEELMTPITRDEFVASMLQVLADLGLPTTAWQETSTVRELIYTAANSDAILSDSITPAARAGLLDYAEGQWLTLTASQEYGVERIESTIATGDIRLTETEGVPQSFSPGDVRVLNEDTGKTYTNTTGGTLSANGTLILAFAADEPGSASDLVDGQTLSLVIAIPGVTPSWVADLLGQDQETDAALRDRCRDSMAAASPNGPADAYDYFAKSTIRPDGTAIGVTRSKTAEANATVTLYVADADGAITSPDVAYIQENIDLHVTPTGFTAIVLSAATLGIPIALSLRRTVGASASIASLEVLITAAIASYFSSIPVGGETAQTFHGVFKSTIVQRVRNAGGDNVADVVVTAPASDVALANNQVPVISGSVAYTWT